MGPSVIKGLSIKTPIAKGLALGMGAHGVGTNKAIEYGRQEATFSSLAMIFAALITLIWGAYSDTNTNEFQYPSYFLVLLGVRHHVKFSHGA